MDRAEETDSTVDPLTFEFRIVLPITEGIRIESKAGAVDSPPCAIVQRIGKSDLAELVEEARRRANFEKTSKEYLRGLPVKSFGSPNQLKGNVDDG